MPRRACSRSGAGGAKARGLIREVMTDKRFVATYFSDDEPNARSYTKTPSTTFASRSCQPRCGKSKPHDYGPGRAIHGQAEDETGRGRRRRKYRLGPGTADVGARPFVQWQ